MLKKITINPELFKVSNSHKGRRVFSFDKTRKKRTKQENSVNINAKGLDSFVSSYQTSFDKNNTKGLLHGKGEGGVYNKAAYISNEKKEDLKNKILSKIRSNKFNNASKTKKIKNNKEGLNNDILLDPSNESNKRSLHKENEFLDAQNYLLDLSNQYAKDIKDSLIDNKQSHLNIHLNRSMQQPDCLLSRDRDIYVDDIMNKCKDNNTQPPYSCLKNGSRPTYRQYMKTRKNYNHIINKVDVIRPPTPPKPSDDVCLNGGVNNRSEKLKKIREKLTQTIYKLKEEHKFKQNNVNSKNIDVNINKGDNIYSNIDNIDNIDNLNLENINNLDDLDILDNENNYEKIQKHKFSMDKDKQDNKFYSTIINRKYNIGKQNKTNKVGLLIKDNKTKKKIIKKQKELKFIEIDKIKNYLYKKGLLKMDSNPPNDVIRQIYENCFLTGDIINKNPSNFHNNVEIITQKILK